MASIVAALLPVFFILASKQILSLEVGQSDVSLENKDMMDLVTRIENINLEEIMATCNESFRIDMNYLNSLNETGSFPDETDKTPKCYMRCYLERTGVMSDIAEIDSDAAAMLFEGSRGGKPMTDLPEITAACAKNRDEKCKCERAYNFVKCIMETEIEKYE